MGGSAGDVSAPVRCGCLGLQEEQPCEGSSVGTKAERSDRQQSIENVRISTLTLESTVLPLTPSFDIFRGAGFTQHRERQLTQQEV